MRSSQSLEFENMLRNEYNCEFTTRIKHLEGSRVFFNKLQMNLRRNKIVKFDSDRFQRFLDYKHKEILASGEDCYIYRISGKLFLLRKINGTWENQTILSDKIKL